MVHTPALRLLNSGPCCSLPSLAKTTWSLSLSEWCPEAALKALERSLAFGVDYVEKEIGFRSFSNTLLGIL